MSKETVPVTIASTETTPEYVIEQPLDHGVPTAWQSITLPSAVATGGIYLNNEDGDWRIWPWEMPEDTPITVERTRQFVAELVAAADLAERLNVEATGRHLEIRRGGVGSYDHKGHYHLSDELLPDGTTRRYVLAAPTGRDHPADTAAPGDEWTCRKNEKEGIDKDHHYRHVGLFDLSRVTYDPVDGTRIATFVEVTGAAKAVYDLHVTMGDQLLDIVDPGELDRIVARNGLSAEAS